MRPSVTNENVVSALDDHRQRQKFGSLSFLAPSALSRSQYYGQTFAPSALSAAGHGPSEVLRRGGSCRRTTRRPREVDRGGLDCPPLQWRLQNTRRWHGDGGGRRRGKDA